MMTRFVRRASLLTIVLIEVAALGAGLPTPPNLRPQVSSALVSGNLRSAPVRGRETRAQQDRSIEGPYRVAVEADWAAQERRLGRTMESREAFRDLIVRADRVIERLEGMTLAIDLRAEKGQLGRLKRETASLESLDPAARRNVYLKARWVLRSAVLKNPLLAGRPLVFLQRRRFISQMLHEYLGYYYDYANIDGGGVYVLEEPSRSMKRRDLIQGRLPRGNYTTLALSYDAKTVYFAFCERAPSKPNYYSAERRAFHLYAVDADGRNLRQLTFGPDDEFDPCPLPDGGLAFMSTRRGGFGRCHNPWEPLPAYTLHRREPSGEVRTLSFHETNQWHPSVLGDGRIIYTRWDYIDRSAANFHGLWVSNPDGTNPHILFGNYTERINACYQPRAIPDSRRVAFVAGAHHASVGGSLVAVDPAQTRLDAKTGLDRFEAIETLTPEVCFPEAPGWPKTYFHSPWPLAEDFYLVSFSFDPLPGMGPRVEKDTRTGLYYFDRFGNLELLYRDEGISAMYPIPLAPRPVPPAVPSTLDSTLGEEGELYLADVRQSLMPLPAAEKGTGPICAKHPAGRSGKLDLSPFPRGRPITALRIWQVLPKTETHVANQPRLGYANAESARMLLGTVPVESDGSAYFRIPARRPVYVQAVDAQGRAVQTMRSVTYVQPGERRGCVGCHEPANSAPPRQLLAALRRPPSTIVPGPDGTRPFSFVRLVQPVLDRHCGRCHDGGPQTKSKLALTGKPRGEFSVSYDGLRPFVRWNEWGGASIAQAVTFPGHGGADESRLLKVLQDPDHKGQVDLPPADRERIVIWLDGNAPFYGAYSAPERVAQLRGDAVVPPRVQ